MQGNIRVVNVMLSFKTLLTDFVLLYTRAVRY